MRLASDLLLMSILTRALQNSSRFNTNCSRVKANSSRVKANSSRVLVDTWREIFDYSHASVNLELGCTVSRLLIFMIWIHITIWRHIHYLHANHNEGVDKQVIIMNYMSLICILISCLMFEGSFDNFDSLKTLTMRPLFFRKPNTRAKTLTF